MGGDNNQNNIVKLTPREHFLAHWLLWRIHKNRQSAGAFFSMCRNSKNHSYRINTKYYSSKAYAEAREAFAILNKGRKRSPETAIKLKEAYLKYSETEKYKENQINTGIRSKKIHTGKKRKDKTKQAISDGVKLYYLNASPEEIKSRSESNKAIWTDEIKKKSSDKLKGKRSGKESPQFGTIWINNSVDNKKIKNEELNIWISKGYKKGRIVTWNNKKYTVEELKEVNRIRSIKYYSKNKEKINERIRKRRNKPKTKYTEEERKEISKISNRIRSSKYRQRQKIK